MSAGLVAAEELRDLWRRGRAAWVVVGMTVVLSVIAVAMASTAAINLLDAKEGLTALVKITSGVGLALTLFAAADSISGERDRASLESVLLTPVPGPGLVFGKAVAATSWWAAVFVVSVPYLAVVGDSLGLRARGVAAAALTGLILAPLMAVWGALFSVRSPTNAASIGWSVLLVLLMAVPGQIPGAVMRGSIGTAVRAVDPITAGLEFLDRVLIGERAVATVLPWLISPVVWLALSGLLLLRWARRLALEPGT